jgi:hypothetical protein
VRGGGGQDAAFVLGMICGFLFVIIIVLVVAGLILCAAVWLSNKCLPQPVSRRRRYDDYDDDDDEDWSSYNRPRRRSGSGTAIPQPGLGWAIVIVLVNGIANFIANLVIGVVAGAGGAMRNPGAAIAVNCCSFIVNFFISTGLLSAMLPTTYPRACLVWLFQLLICIAIAIIIIVPIFLIAGVGAGRFGR